MAGPARVARIQKTRAGHDERGEDREELSRKVGGLRSNCNRVLFAIEYGKRLRRLIRPLAWTEVDAKREARADGGEDSGASIRANVL
jgi:hypothetical protein